MEKERLTIAQSKVTVEYEFLNESDSDIATEVGFPIPAYRHEEDAGGTQSFDDFRLWVNGAEVKYDVEAKAYLQRYDGRGNKVGTAKDVTALLRKYKIDIPSLGHSIGDQAEGIPDYERLDAAGKKVLRDAGVVEDENQSEWPDWEVRKIYHWRQTFPAHKVLRVKHEYSPAFGFQYVQTDAFDVDSRARLLAKDGRAKYKSGLKADVDLLRTGCLDPATQKELFAKAEPVRKANADLGYFNAAWVDFILTTANNWKTPIKDFELRVERGTVTDRGWYSEDWDAASFCWNGPVNRLDATHYEASAKNLVPSRELRVLFLTLPKAVAK